jgi:microcystin-dependent protein
MSGGASTLDEGGFGGGNSHNNIQPSLVVNYIIYSGV